METVRAPADERGPDPIAVPAGAGDARWWGEAPIPEARLRSSRSPGRPAPNPRRVHHKEDEGFRVLEGKVTLDVGDTTIVATAGDYASARRGPKNRRAGRISLPWSRAMDASSFDE